MRTYTASESKSLLQLAVEAGATEAQAEAALLKAANRRDLRDLSMATSPPSLDLDAVLSYVTA